MSNDVREQLRSHFLRRISIGTRRESLSLGCSSIKLALTRQSTYELGGMLPQLIDDIDTLVLLLSDRSQPQAKDWAAH